MTHLRSKRLPVLRDVNTPLNPPEESRPMKTSIRRSRRAAVAVALGSVLALTAIAMATASTVCGALLVENGQRLSASAAFINQQWLWFNVAVMAASLAGGALVEVLSPAGALHAAAAIAASTALPPCLRIRCPARVAVG